MILLRHRIAAAIAALALALAPAAELADNSASAINTKDNSSVIKIAFKIERVVKDVVTTTNAAVAVSSCSACQTVAIAIDVVFVQSDPTVYTPTNLALALNIGCSSCNTLADAYQFVISTGGALRLTPQGAREIAGIRRQLELLRQCDCSIMDIQAQVTVLTDQLKQVLSTELVPVQNDEDKTNQNQDGSPRTDQSPSPSPSGSPGQGTAPGTGPAAPPSASPAPIGTSPSPAPSSTP